ncbi:MAG: hypothetical protein JSV96_04575 [Candidatus Aminicenantes bacterium]|nr:MAG: hypothetical protein JSV96_04575 [Candidatus Aminicenantes bacterium]
MINLERRFGPLPLRVWGLVLNFFGNALAIYGAIGVIRDGSRLPLLLIGGCITLLCIVILSKPSAASR